MGRSPPETTLRPPHVAGQRQPPSLALPSCNVHKTAAVARTALPPPLRRTGSGRAGRAEAVGARCVAHGAPRGATAAAIPARARASAGAHAVSGRVGGIDALRRRVLRGRYFTFAAAASSRVAAVLHGGVIPCPSRQVLFHHELHPAVHRHPARDLAILRPAVVRPASLIAALAAAAGGLPPAVLRLPGPTDCGAGPPAAAPGDPGLFFGHRLLGSAAPAGEELAQA